MTEPLPFAREIILDDVSFAYPTAAKSAINNVSLEIPLGTRVGFVGSTGSGKTTTIDIILGLLDPTSGRLLADGTPIDAQNVRSWQANLGYVPQHIYLADDTVAGNIALGVPPRKIDQDAVERAARIASIHDFVVNEMPQGYRTMVGERGVRLSGGQRQRIGVARALYRDPSVLLFDEATSALDNLTEKAVMQGLQSLGRDRTIIFIAHRLSTVRNCDVIYLFAGGRITASGTYDELTASSAEFQLMTAHGS
jgi:ATP-binding cassette, subfamily B, bacterial PglK